MTEYEKVYVVVGPYVTLEDPRLVTGPIAGFTDASQAEQFRSSWSRCMRERGDVSIIPATMNGGILQEGSGIAIYRLADEAAIVEGARIGHYLVDPIRPRMELEPRS